MSFQDVGKSSKKSTQTNQRSSAFDNTAAYNVNANGGETGHGGNAGTTSSSRGTYNQLSDGILQYQRNIGILENIIKQAGTKSDGPVLQTQYKVQLDVIKQLGKKIEKQLRSQEINIESMSRTEAARSRATYVKLTRDYRRVETSFKNLQLESRRKRDLVEAQRRDRDDEDRRKSEGGGDGSENEAMRVQMQVQEDLVNEEIMREREEEIRNINKGMYTVNAIYKDLANIVATQQEDVDMIEETMDDTNEKTKGGLAHIEKANASQGTCVIS